jgi:hypothetical protein
LSYADKKAKLNNSSLANVIPLPSWVLILQLFNVIPAVLLLPIP